MAPSVASYSPEPAISDPVPIILKNAALTKEEPTRPLDIDYAAGLKDGRDGKYAFAPIHEAQVSRAMIKRYFLSRRPQHIL